MKTSIKATFIGGPKVGKTAFLKQFVEHKFNSNYIETPGVDFKRKNCALSTDHEWRLWDLSIQGLIKSMVAGYLKESHAIFIFVDSTRPTESIKELVNFQPIPKNAVCTVIFTKSDHKKAFKPTEAACLSYVGNIQLKLNIPAIQFRAKPSYFITSAKNNRGINSAMKAMEMAILPAKYSENRLFNIFNGNSEQKVTVPAFGRPTEHQEEKPPEVSITFNELGF